MHEFSLLLRQSRRAVRLLPHTEAVVSDERFEALSTDAKLLYGMLIDRMELSMKNGWTDKDGRVFIYFTLEDARERLKCGTEKIVKLFAELDSEKGIGLIECVRQA